MAVDFATLSITVKRDDVPKATAELDRLAQAGDRAGSEAGEQSGASDTSDTGNESTAGDQQDSTTEQESGSETSANDGPGGHADEPGNPNANHEAQGQE